MKGFMCDKMTLYHDTSFFIYYFENVCKLKKIIFNLTNYSRRLGRFKICFLVLPINKFVDH